jgi:hypothetical protein
MDHRFRRVQRITRGDPTYTPQTIWINLEALWKVIGRNSDHPLGEHESILS